MKERLLLALSLCGALALANLWSGYASLSESLHYFSNGPLLAPFFLRIGQEIRHEFVDGEISQPRKALAPVIGAIGGMVVPAVIYSLLSPGSREWVVAMPTDIALVLAVLAFTPKASPALRIFLLTLAVADDLFSIVVLGLLFGGELSIDKIAYSLGAVALGLAIPRKPSQILQDFSSLLIVPLYIFLNFGFVLTLSDFTSTPSISLAIARVVGKVLGITVFLYIATKLRIAIKSEKLSYKDISAGALLAGNGLTVALFMAELASDQIELMKSGLLMAIILSSLVGTIFLRRISR